MVDAILKWEREYIREVAKEKLETANLPIMKKRVKMWTDHNDLKSDTPMVTVDLGQIKEFKPELRCETERARDIERNLKVSLVRHKMIGDDFTVTPEYICNWIYKFTPFNLPPEKVTTSDSIGYHIVEQIKDLEKDKHLLQKSEIKFHKEDTINQFEIINDLIGDILTVRYGFDSGYTCLSADLVSLMTMENMFYSILDHPDLFHEAMNALSDDYLELFKGMEERGMLLGCNGGINVRWGSYGFTSQLPSNWDDNPVITTKDCWGYANSQETVGISPDMFEEFFFPYYKKITDIWGLVSYGCCEPVHDIWDSCLSKMKNLRKVSISPWCDQRFIGERLANSNTIFYRKPSPNYLGVEKAFDEAAFRAHVHETVEAAKGCKLEFCFRDIYDLHGAPGKMKRAVEIVREETERYYQA